MRLFISKKMAAVYFIMLVSALSIVWSASIRVNDPAIQKSAVFTISAVIFFLSILTAIYHTKTSIDHLSTEFRKKIDELNTTKNKTLIQEKMDLLGKISGIIGHELRNPLGAIKNSVYYLNMTCSNHEAEIKETLEIINKEVGRADQMIRDLLDFSRSKPVEKKPVFLIDLLKDILQTIKIPDNVKVVECFVSQIPVLAADVDQLRSAFHNVIVDALNSMPDGGTLTLDLKRIDGELEIGIFYTGDGIFCIDRENVFEPFINPKSKGIGLELAVAKKIIETHNGTIAFKCREGSYSGFYIQLPET